MAYKINKAGSNWLVIVLAVLVVLGVFYVGYDQYSKHVVKQQQQDVKLVQSGAQLGYQQAVVDVLKQAANCKPVPIRYKNQTLNLIAVECLTLNKNQAQQTSPKVAK